MLSLNFKKVFALIIFSVVAQITEGQHAAQKPESVQGMKVPTHTQRVEVELESGAVVITAPKENYLTVHNLNNTPSIAVKTNLLYDATLSGSLGFEFKMSNKTSIDISGAWRLFDMSDESRFRFFLLQPEFRFWACESFSGHFFGLHAHYGEYNVGGLPNPPFSKTMHDYRFEGWLAGAGLSYGYHWVLGKRWGLEATVGLGWTHLNYDKYNCGKCGDKIASESKNFLGPTKVGVSLIYIIK